MILLDVKIILLTFIIDFYWFIRYKNRKYRYSYDRNNLYILHNYFFQFLFHFYLLKCRIDFYYLFTEQIIYLNIL